MKEMYLGRGPAVELYDVLHADVPAIKGDVNFYRRHARKTGGPILELACGTGRVAIPLARDGHEVVGLDLSPHMLAIARGKTSDVTWARGDMERFALRRKFRLILIPFRSFARLLTPEAQRRCLECVRRHLAPGGRFIVNIFDPKLEFCLPKPVPFPRRPPVRDSTGRTWRVTAERRNDPVAQVLHEVWTWRDGRTTWRDRLTLRWTYRHEMRHLLELCGFRPLACHGDFRGGPPKYGREQIWVCTAYNSRRSRASDR